MFQLGAQTSHLRMRMLERPAIQAGPHRIWISSRTGSQRTDRFAFSRQTTVYLSKSRLASQSTDRPLLDCHATRCSQTYRLTPFCRLSSGVPRPGPPRPSVSNLLERQDLRCIGPQGVICRVPNFRGRADHWPAGGTCMRPGRSCRCALDCRTSRGTRRPTEGPCVGGGSLTRQWVPS
jgi:hypothetical protein